MSPFSMLTSSLNIDCDLPSLASPDSSRSKSHHIHLLFHPHWQLRRLRDLSVTYYHFDCIIINYAEGYVEVNEVWNTFEWGCEWVPMSAFVVEADDWAPVNCSRFSILDRKMDRKCDEEEVSVCSLLAHLFSCWHGPPKSPSIPTEICTASPPVMRRYFASVFPFSQILFSLSSHSTQSVLIIPSAMRSPIDSRCWFRIVIPRAVAAGR